MSKSEILVNLQRCIGCWTCSLACKVGNDLPDEVYWQTVRTLGSGEGIDRPAGEWPNLRMSWMPIWSCDCVKCAERLSANEAPYCVHACPTHALSWGDEVSSATQALREQGFRIFKLPAWEKSRDDVTYASKG